MDEDIAIEVIVQKWAKFITLMAFAINDLPEDLQVQLAVFLQQLLPIGLERRIQDMVAQMVVILPKSDG